MSNRTSPTKYRDKAFEKYGKACYVCDSQQNVVVHHVDGDEGNNEIDNLLPLCNSCHMRVHNGGSGSMIDKLQAQLPDHMTNPNREKDAKTHDGRAQVKAKVPERVQRALKVEAAQYDMPVYEVAGQELIEWYEDSEHSDE